MTVYSGTFDVRDEQLMRRAMSAALQARLVARPNPWVGAVVIARNGSTFEGCTAAPGGPHAEISALRHAGEAARGATLYSTLEPCSHTGRTGPCTRAIIDAGVERVVVGVLDPDAKVAGKGIEQLRDAGVTVDVGVCAELVRTQLAPYLHHRTTGRPWVVLKMASTLDGRTAAADGSSRWITGEIARQRVHELRAESDAVLVGAGTVRADDPALTVRDAQGPSPRRIVLGSAPDGAKVHPCTEWSGDLESLLDSLGAEGVVQLLVEGGARVAADFHRLGLVDRYVFHLAPAIAGGDDAPGVFSGTAAANIADMWRGRIVSLQQLGDDVEVVVEPTEFAERQDKR
ncbi:MAG: diaminohydroxyphosphoribosylaminopyrimidine deaminase [Actinomycetota bacterium]|jgi:diaminohydroxyphosphoribosylaminopyrimidine deaminase/5-amino-6-(5-phosphoribosylamino)uracil reductase